jgi:hypothetical protein
MSLIDRIGIDIGRKLPIEWAAQHGVRAIDVQTDIAPNALESFDDARCMCVHEACSKFEVSLALHTLSLKSLRTCDRRPTRTSQPTSRLPLA